MPDGNGFLFSFSGQRANKKGEVFYETQRQIRALYPRLPVVFLDDVISKKPLPIYWSEAHRSLHPTTRLLMAFAEFNEAGIRMIRPAIAAGNIVVTLRYGLDVFLDSIAETDCPQALSEASELWHKHLVPSRIIRHTPKPQYFINRVLRATESNVVSFCSRQERHIAEYFDGTGQKPPIYLSGETVEECVAEAIRQILNVTAESRKLAT